MTNEKRLEMHLVEHLPSDDDIDWDDESFDTEVSPGELMFTFKALESFSKGNLANVWRM